MNINTIDSTTSRWDNMTYQALNLQEISLSDIQILLKDTYHILTEVHKDELVPKSICKLLLTMDEFLYFSSMMEANEKGVDFYHYQYISNIVSALKTGFFKGEYEEPFPKLKIYGSEKNEIVIGFENDIDFDDTVNT